MSAPSVVARDLALRLTRTVSPKTTFSKYHDQIPDAINFRSENLSGGLKIEVQKLKNVSEKLGIFDEVQTLMKSFGNSGNDFIFNFMTRLRSPLESGSLTKDDLATLSSLMKRFPDAADSLPEFLSNVKKSFDPSEYASLVKSGGITAIISRSIGKRNSLCPKEMTLSFVEINASGGFSDVISQSGFQTQQNSFDLSSNTSVDLVSLTTPLTLVELPTASSTVSPLVLTPIPNPLTKPDSPKTPISETFAISPILASTPVSPNVFSTEAFVSSTDLNSAVLMISDEKKFFIGVPVITLSGAPFAEIPDRSDDLVSAFSPTIVNPKKPQENNKPSLPGTTLVLSVSNQKVFLPISSTLVAASTSVCISLTFQTPISCNFGKIVAKTSSQLTSQLKLQNPKKSHKQKSVPSPVLVLTREKKIKPTPKANSQKKSIKNSVVPSSSSAKSKTLSDKKSPSKIAQSKKIRTRLDIPSILDKKTKSSPSSSLLKKSKPKKISPARYPNIEDVLLKNSKNKTQKPNRINDNNKIDSKKSRKKIEKQISKIVDNHKKKKESRKKLLILLKSSRKKRKSKHKLKS